MNKWGILSNMIILYDINAIQTNIIKVLGIKKDIILTTGMKFVHNNIRSLWPKLTNLRTMLGNIDFLGIIET